MHFSSVPVVSQRAFALACCMCNFHRITGNRKINITKWLDNFSDFFFPLLCSGHCVLVGLVNISLLGYCCNFLGNFLTDLKNISPIRWKDSIIYVVFVFFLFERENNEENIFPQSTTTY